MGGKPRPTGDTTRLSKQLLEAANRGRTGEIEPLIADGAGFVVDNSSALAWATWRGHVEIVELLIKHGADPNAGDGYPCDGSAMHAGADAGRVDILELLVAAGGDVTQRNSSRGTQPLHRAAAKGRADAVAYLIERGADPSSRETRAFGRTVLEEAAGGGSVEVLAILGSRGASVKGGSRPPIHHAILNHHTEAAKWLLEAGADPNEREEAVEMPTPLHAACELYEDEGAAEFVEMLINAGADVNARQKSDGWTALHLAAKEGVLATVDLLLKHGADRQLTVESDPEFSDALSIAVFYGHDDVVDRLRKG